jgi:peptidoglycan/LPS O-acetylase OafA/YrhL
VGMSGWASQMGGAIDKTRTGRYIPTLDGWRAIAVMSVCLAHIAPLPFPGTFGHRLALIIWKSGGGGVSIFFGISGLLICSRLLDEEEQSGRISLKDFYIRRAFRILPAALFFLLILAVLHRYAGIPLSALDWFAGIFFFRNYTVAPAPSPLTGWFTSHFWSLSIEEHFYLLLPALLILLPRRRWRLGALLGLTTLSFLWKLSVQSLFHLDLAHLSIWRNFHTGSVIDALLIPAAIAVYMRRAEAKRKLERLLRSRVFLACLIPVSFYFFYHERLWPWEKLAVPLCILATVLNSESTIGRLLESRLFAGSAASLTAFICGKRSSCVAGFRCNCRSVGCRRSRGISSSCSRAPASVTTSSSGPWSASGTRSHGPRLTRLEPSALTKPSRSTSPRKNSPPAPFPENPPYDTRRVDSKGDSGSRRKTAGISPTRLTDPTNPMRRR